MRELLFMKPCFSHTIWGGTRLRDVFGYDEQGDDIGECWGISAHPGGDDTITGGQYDGKKLSEVYFSHPELFGNIDCDRFPLLIKIIDAKEDLSIQVHPDDEYASTHENGSYGKTECWYIIDCPDNAKLVIGHNAGTHEELVSMIEAGRWNEFIRYVPIKKGDFIQIEPGTVHAITAGCMLLETQQSSDITYRVYDYGRLMNGSPRELHIKQSMDVITVPAPDTGKSVRNYINIPADELYEIESCRLYKVFKIVSEKGFAFNMVYPFMNMSVIDGEGSIDGTYIKKGMHFIIPSGYGKVHIDGKMTIIASTVN